jgi:malate dehydrogenase (oxaloacetate-decarboxylating)
LLQWEDFGAGNGRRILQKYGRDLRTFNDDLQGTGAITLAAIVSALRICGTALRNQRIVIFGTGLAGIGIADLIRDVLIDGGLSAEEATRRFWCVDTEGLLSEDLGTLLHDYQAPYARPAAEVRSWKRFGDSVSNTIGIAEVISRVRPTILIGTSGIGGAFTETMVREMARYTDRPIIFPLSSPSSSAEATPENLISWTAGRALIATGSPFAPVTHKGITHVVGLATNAMLYPGLGLGTIVSRARLVSVGMLTAAANALSSLVAVRLPGSSLLPHIDDLRRVTVTIAVAVAEAALVEGLASVEFEDIVKHVEDAMWRPEYCTILAS